MRMDFVEHVKRPKARHVLELRNADGSLALRRIVEPDGTIRDEAT